MRIVLYKDSRGFLRRRMIPDDEGDEKAEFGLPAGTPDIEHELDWEALIRDINNILVQDGVITRTDLQRQQSLLKICNLVKRRIDDVFRGGRHG